MDTITAKDGTPIYYKDWGRGPVVTFSHGWPLNADAVGRPDAVPRAAGLSRDRARPARPRPFRSRRPRAMT